MGELNQRSVNEVFEDRGKRDLGGVQISWGSQKKNGDFDGLLEVCTELGKWGEWAFIRVMTKHGREKSNCEERRMAIAIKQYLVRLVGPITVWHSSI